VLREDVLTVKNCVDQQCWSGRPDLNRRPQRPERCALAKLRYSPTASLFYLRKRSRSTTPKKQVRLAVGGAHGVPG